MEIRTILKSIWEKEIKDYYAEGRICSERNLQAEFYHHLRNKLKDDAVIWVEPTLSFKEDIEGLTKMKPDLLITEHNAIIAVIELKYNPASEVHHKDDLKKLYNFSRVVDNGLRLKTDIYSGGFVKEEFYTVSKNIVTCFAVVCRHFGHAVKREEWKEINTHDNFLHLTGIVYKEAKKVEFQCS